MTRLTLFERVWSGPLTVLAPQFAISDVALKNSCRRFGIPVSPRGYWAKLQAGKPTTKIALPPRAAGMDDEVVVGGGIRAYVDAVRAVVANETTSIWAEKLERWSKWALAEADRIDPLRSAFFLRVFDVDDDAN